MENKGIIKYSDDNYLQRYRQIFVNIPEINEFYFKLDEPVNYKELIFYPVKMKFYLFFKIFSGCLTLEKNRVPNVKIIKMKYLDYLFLVDKELNIDNSIYISYLRELLLLCLRLPEEFYTPNGDKINTIDFIYQEGHWLIRIYNNTYDNNDFLKIREIICKQNLVELPDETIHPDLLKKYEKWKDFMKKTGRLKEQELEDLIMCVCAETNYTKENIKEMSIRFFFNLLDRIGFIMQYKINSLLAPHLDEKAIKKLPNWTDKIKKLSMMEEMGLDLQEFENGIKNKDSK